MIRRDPWEESCIRFRTLENFDYIYPSLVISEQKYRWKDFKLGRIIFVPMQSSINISHEIIDGKMTEFKYPSLYTNLVYTTPNPTNLSDESFIGTGVSHSRKTYSRALATFLTFCTESLFIAYNTHFPPFNSRGGRLFLSQPGRLWAETWSNVFNDQYGFNIFRHSPLFPDDEQEKMNIAKRLYKKMLSYDEAFYHRIMRMMRLYEYAFFSYRVDKSLSYTFFVASLESISDKSKVKRK